jgi:transcriptional regulator with XRE-family HTH domain
LRNRNLFDIYNPDSIRLQYRNRYRFRNGNGMAENFDTEAFYAALNAARLSRQKTWKDVAQEAGVAASTLSRMGQGAKPDVNGLAALLKWSNLKAEMFIRGAGNKEAPPIAKLTALLRADPHLTPQNAKLMEEIVVSTYNKLRGS